MARRKKSTKKANEPGVMSYQEYKTQKNRQNGIYTKEEYTARKNAGQFSRPSIGRTSGPNAIDDFFNKLKEKQRKQVQNKVRHDVSGETQKNEQLAQRQYKEYQNYLQQYGQLKDIMRHDVSGETQRNEQQLQKMYGKYQDYIRQDVSGETQKNEQLLEKKYNKYKEYKDYERKSVDADAMRDEKLLRRDYEAWQKARAYNTLGYNGAAQQVKQDGTGTIYSTGQHRALAAARETARDQGLLNDQNDPQWMDNAGLEKWTGEMGGRADELLAQRNEILKQKGMKEGYRPELGWGQVYDYLFNLQRGKAEDMLKQSRDPEDQKAAKQAMSKLDADYDAGRESVIRDALSFSRTGYRNTDLNGDPAYLREYFYDEIMPDFYGEKIRDLTEEERAELDSRIDDAIRWMANPYEQDGRNYDQEADSLAKEAFAYRKQQNAGQAELEYRKKMQDYAGQAAAIKEDGSYDPSLHPEPGIEFYGMYDKDAVAAPKGTEVQKAYYWMNNQDAMEKVDTYRYANKYLFANAEQVDQFNKFYKHDIKYGTNYAESFLEGLDSYLTSRLTEYKDYYARATTEDPWVGIPSRVLSYLYQPAAGFTGMVGSGLAALGVKSAQDINSWWYDDSRYITNLRDQGNEKVDAWAVRTFGKNAKGVGKFLMNVMDSILDNAVAMGAGYGMAAGMVNEQARVDRAMRVVQLIMSSEATSNTMVRQLEANKDPREAAVYAIADGIIEWVTEKYSLEQLMRPDAREILKAGGAPKFLAKVTAAEGSEEIAADLMNIGLDKIISAVQGHETELQERMNELIVNEKMDPGKAWNQALMEKAGEVLMSGLAGSISGFVLGAGRLGKARVSQIAGGRTISGVNSLTDESGTEQILKRAEAMNEGSESRKMAAKIRERMEKQGKKAGSLQLGQLTQTMQMESQEKIGEAARGAIHRNAEAALQKKGVENAAELARVIAKQQTEGSDSLTRAERSLLTKSQEALDVVKELGGKTGLAKTVRSEIADETKGYAETLRATANLTNGRTAEGVNVKNVGQQMATEDDIRRAERNGSQRIDSAKEVLIRGRFGTLEGMEKTTDDKGKTVWKYKVNVDGQTELAEASDIKATRFATAAVIRDQAGDGTLPAGRFTGTLIDLIDKGNVQNVGTFFMDAFRIRKNAYMGKAMPEVKIEQAAAKEIYRVSLLDAQDMYQENQKQAGGANFKGVGKGRLIYHGIQYGTETLENEIKDLDENRKNQLREVAKWAKISGVELTVKDLDETKEKNWRLHGSENSQGIMLVLDSYDTKADAEAKTNPHHLVVTLGHEMTHWLQRNNAAGYIELKNYVLQTLEEEGVDVWNEAETLVARRKGTKNELNILQAIDEIVADACDQVLTNKEAAAYLKKNNMSLFKKVQNYVKDLISRITKGNYNTKDSASRYSVLLMKHANELSKIWLDKYNEVLTGQIRQMEQATGEGTARASMTELNDEYMDAVENGNILTQKKLVAQAAKKAGYTDKVYHGTRDFGFTQFDMKRSQGAIFATYNVNLAQTYTHDASIRQIKNAVVGDLKQFSNEKLLEAARDVMTDFADEKIDSWELLPNGKFRMTYHDSWYNNKLVKLDYDRRSLEQNIRSRLHNNKQGEGIYQFYADPGRQFVVDARRSDWNRIRLDDADVAHALRGIDDSVAPKYYEYTTRELVEYAKSRGYDSIRINNVQDKSMYNAKPWNINQGVYGDIVAYFNPEQIKSADPVVYDDAGKVIPLQERFNAKKTDIRYSYAEEQKNTEGDVLGSMVDDTDNMELIKTVPSDDASIAEMMDSVNEDKAYSDAVERGDIKTATRMLMNKLAKTNGIIPIKTWEWDAGRSREIARLIKELDPKAVQEAAENMAKLVPDNAVLIPMPPHSGQVTENTDTMVLAKAISKITGRPVVVALEGAERTEGRHKQKSRGEQGASQQELGFRKVAEIPEGTMPIFVDNIVGKGVTADAARQAMGGGMTLAYTKTIRSNGIVGLKNAVITYDTNKNLIPLSQRFDISKRDVRFSMTSPVEETRDLIAVHNLTERNLIDTLREGGFTAPSIAVIQAREGHSKYGPISVIFYKNTIDPRRSIKNKIYGADAWTPTRGNAQIETKLNYEVLQNARETLQGLMKDETASLWQRDAEAWINRLLYEDQTNESLDDLITRAYNNDGMIIAYERAKGREIQRKTERVKHHSELQEAFRDVYDGFLNKLEEKGMLQEFMDDMSKLNGNEILDKYSEIFRESGDRAAHIVDVYYKNKDSVLNKNVLFSKMKQARWYEQDGREIKFTREFSKAETAEAIRDNLNKNEFDDWVGNLLEGALGEKGVYNGSDLFTRMGNKRSFSATHWAPTAENIVKAMYMNHETKGGEAGGATGLIAKASKEYKSINDVRQDKGRLQQVEEEEYKERINNLDDALNDFVYELQQSNRYESSTIKSILIDAAGDYARTESAAVLKASLKKQGINLTDEQLKQMMGLLQDAREIPTGYFEAKPERVVGLDEIARVILPEDVENELIDALKNNNINYETYDGTEEDRLEKLNSRESERFSFTDDENMSVAAWMQGLTESMLQTEGERRLLHDYKSLRLNQSLEMERQSQYTKKIRQLEAKDTLTAEERDELVTLRNKLQNSERRQAELENELYRVTGSEGYAGMMYRQTRILNDYVYGKTQDQVAAAVEQMVQEAEQTKADLAARAARLKKLAESQAVKTMQSYMNKASLSKMTSMLKKEYSSTLSRSEIDSRLAAMALRMAQGENIAAEAEGLAADLLNNQRTEISDDLAYVKTNRPIFTISEEDVKQLKEMKLTLKGLRENMRGSGITIRMAKNANIFEQWADVREKNQGLPDLYEQGNTNGASMAVAIADWVKNQMDDYAGNQYEKPDSAMVTAHVMAAAGSVSTYLVNDEAARNQINSLMKDIEALAKEAESAADAIDAMSERMDRLQLAGTKAQGWTSVLKRDVNVAIDYYSEIAKQAVAVERQRMREGLIQQLKSENTRKLIEQQEMFEKRIERDKNARKLREDNEHLRKQITTNISRLKKLLTEETDKKNIQEEAKPLARQISKMILEHQMHGGRPVMALEEGEEDYWPTNGRRVLYGTKKSMAEFLERLQKMDLTAGTFDVDRDLDWLVVKAQNPDDNDYSMRDKVLKDLMDIERGLIDYQRSEGRGNVTLKDRNDALNKIQKAVSEITEVIKARSEAFIDGRYWQIYELAEKMRIEMENSRFKGEWKNKPGKVVGTVWNAIGYGNMTPEYFIKNLHNSIMEMLHGGMKDAENRGGLLANRARQRIAEIVAETGFNTWDGQEKHEITLVNGQKITMTTEQLMALYATWLRESNALRPEETSHLLKGGIVLPAAEDGKGMLKRERIAQRPIRIKATDISRMTDMLTDAQRQYVDAVVAYMSNDLAKIGNEASMQTYGIKKFTEQYYYPIKSWGGVLNQSSASGTNSNNDNRAMRQSFTKRVTSNANNAIEITDFTPTAMKHIVGMINFNTVGPAVENLNKVLNQQLEYGKKKTNQETGEEEDETYKRNMRAAFQESYGQDAYKYLTTFMKDVNGGTAQGTGNGIYDRLLSAFKKNAVAGSLSVAAQQPLSYIRAAMLINPKYMAQAVNPKYYKGSYAEMMAHSGVAVIKEMGKFDMNYGRSMIDWITPEGKISKGKEIWNKVSEKSTALPQKMDAMTWTRMWTACKLEQAALHPEMDVKSDEFLDLVAKRFNEVMRRTQVYDSVMVKSQNMRNTGMFMKGITSFMAEPTLSLNVLADAWMNRKEKGGKANVGKAIVTFMMSAAMQAAVKSMFGTGRSPDKKKTMGENYLYKLTYNLINEANPLGLIPGYSSLIEVLQNGELTDNSWGVIAQYKKAKDNLWSVITGSGDKTAYRKLEDSVCQLMQLMTNIPAKNFARDFRAMVNLFSGGAAKGLTGDTFANRQSSKNVLKYQFIDLLATEDLIGYINKRLGDAGYKTDNKAYYQRLYDAKKSGNTVRAAGITDYLLNGKGVKKETIDSNIKTLTKEDEQITDEEKIKSLRDQGMKDSDIAEWITKRRKEGKLTKEEAERLYVLANPKKDANDAYFHFEQQEWEKETGNNVSESDYFRMNAAIDSDSMDDFKTAMKELTEHGYKEKDVLEQASSYIMKKYKEGEDRSTTEKKLNKFAGLDENAIWWKIDLVDYKKETGNDEASGYYYRLADALNANKAEDIRKEMKELTKHGIKEEDVLEQTAKMIMNNYKDGTADRRRTEQQLEEIIGLDKNETWWKIDRVDYKKETGDDSVSGYYYRLTDAVNANRAEKITAAVKDLLAHGITKEKIKTKLSGWKSEYLAADSAGKVKIRDAITKAYKAAGYTAADAEKTIKNWTKEKKKKNSSEVPAGGRLIASTGMSDSGFNKKHKLQNYQELYDEMYKYTEGKLYGIGTIDLNHRQVVHNKDGSISTERSITVGFDDGEYLIPTVVNGKILSEDEAIEHFLDTNEYLGVFDSVEEAEEYAEMLHNRQDWYYHR